jgi:hypothetical protein
MHHLQYAIQCPDRKDWNALVDKLAVLHTPTQRIRDVPKPSCDAPNQPPGAELRVPQQNPKPCLGGEHFSQPPLYKQAPEESAGTYMPVTSSASKSDSVARPWDLAPPLLGGEAVRALGSKAGQMHVLQHCLCVWFVQHPLCLKHRDCSESSVCCDLLS